MKTEKLVQLAVMTLMVCAVAAGCSKKPQNTTPLYGSGAGLTDRPGGPMNDVASPIASEPGAGIAATDRNFDSWPADRETFKDQTVFFDYDKSNVRPSEVAKLEQIASQMRSTHTGKAIRIEGHCDERGTEEYNRSLGERRAQSVRETLVRLGLDASMVQTITFGEERPQNMEHDESAWSKNRRGEIILLSPPPIAQGGTQ